MSSEYIWDNSSAAKGTRANSTTCAARELKSGSHGRDGSGSILPKMSVFGSGWCKAGFRKRKIRCVSISSSLIGPANRQKDYIARDRVYRDLHRQQTGFHLAGGHAETYHVQANRCASAADESWTHLLPANEDL